MCYVHRLFHTNCCCYSRLVRLLIFTPKFSFSCGYCGVGNPDIDHVEAEHWKRLSRSVALRNSGKEQWVLLKNRDDKITAFFVNVVCPEPLWYFRQNYEIIHRLTCLHLLNESSIHPMLIALHHMNQKMIDLLITSNAVLAWKLATSGCQYSHISVLSVFIEMRH